MLTNNFAWWPINYYEPGVPHILWPEWNSGDDCRIRSEPPYRLQDTPSSALIKKDSGWKKLSKTRIYCE